jgi:hypothetical protein
MVSILFIEKDSITLKKVGVKRDKEIVFNCFFIFKNDGNIWTEGSKEQKKEGK